MPTVSVPKASQKRDLAQKYIAGLLSPEGQLCFGQSQFAGPTNRKVQLPADLAKLVPYGPLVQRMFFPDTDLVATEVPGVVGALGARDRALTPRCRRARPPR